MNVGGPQALAARASSPCRSVRLYRVVLSAIKTLSTTYLILVVLLHWTVEAQVLPVLLRYPHLASNGLVFTAVIQAVSLGPSMLVAALEGVLFEVVPQLTDFYLVGRAPEAGVA